MEKAGCVLSFTGMRVSSWVCNIRQPKWGGLGAEWKEDEKWCAPAGGWMEEQEVGRVRVYGWQLRKGNNYVECTHQKLFHYCGAKGVTKLPGITKLNFLFNL